MRPCSALVACALAGCSFVGVRAPVHRDPPVQDPALITCTESSLLPSLDAVAGSFAVAAAVFGGVAEQTEAHDSVPAHFTKYYVGPLLVLGIAYLWSASFGTDRVEHCVDVKAAVIPGVVVTPIDMSGVKPPEPQPEIE